jgi:hypothetical protein
MVARFIFLSFFMLVGALAPTKAQNSFPYPALPDSLRNVEQRAAYLSEHYWDNFNFSDTQTLHQAFCCFRLIILQIGKHIQRLVFNPSHPFRLA